MVEEMKFKTNDIAKIVVGEKKRSHLVRIIDIAGDDVMVERCGTVSIVDVRELSLVKTVSKAQLRRLNHQLGRR